MRLYIVTSILKANWRRLEQLAYDLIILRLSFFIIERWNLEPNLQYIVASLILVWWDLKPCVSSFALKEFTLIVPLFPIRSCLIFNLAFLKLLFYLICCSQSQFWKHLAMQKLFETTIPGEKLILMLSACIILCENIYGLMNLTFTFWLTSFD